MNLKPTGHIEDMHLDKGGAVAVLSTIDTLAKMNAPVNVVGVIPAVENMIDNQSYKPGSILKSYDVITVSVNDIQNKYVEVCNTDAEGRLILADAMAYVQKKYELESMVDIATLTGAICVALGEYSAGLFSNNEEMVKSLIESGKNVQERCWYMPIEEEHEEEIKNCRVADIRSMGQGRDGGACTGKRLIRMNDEQLLPS